MYKETQAEYHLGDDEAVVEAAPSEGTEDKRERELNADEKAELHPLKKEAITNVNGEYRDHIHVRDALLKDYLAQLPDNPAVKDYDELIARLEREKLDVGSGHEVREERTILGSVILRIKKMQDELTYSQRKL